MIVKNEEDTLARCLESIRPAVDEIIIVDTGSLDGTKDIAFSFTNKVYDFKWNDNFSDARNFSFSHAKCEYILWLDADDVVTEENLSKLMQLKATLPPNINLVYMKYHISFDEEGNPTFSYFRERLVKREADPIWIEPVHEAMNVKGPHFLSDIAIDHRKIKENPKNRNLKAMRKYLKSGAELSPRFKFYYARELMYTNRIKSAVAAFKTFLRDRNGWSENRIEAYKNLSECYCLLGNAKAALSSLFTILEFCPPRADVCCQIGKLLSNEHPNAAIFWFENALNSKRADNMGFTEIDFYGFVPAIELCVIHHKLGNAELAKKYNEIAGSYKPNNNIYLYNKEFFSKL